MKGRIGGSLPYGYGGANRIETDGTIERGLRAEYEPEAVVVRRIFRLYAEGMSARAIANLLNEEGVPPPRGERWSGNAINGTRKSGSGILNNELYRGRIVYGRRRYVRDPETRKRRPRLTDESQWTVQEAPELRIVDEALWRRVAARRQAGYDRRRTTKGGQGTPRPLSGLVHCGLCGSRMAIVNEGRYRCLERRADIERCENDRGIAAAELETRAAQKLHDWVLGREGWEGDSGRQRVRSPSGGPASKRGWRSESGAARVSLIVVPDPRAGSRKYGLDGEQIPHLSRLEDSPLGIDERDAFSSKNEARPEFVRGQVIVDFTEP